MTPVNVRGAVEIYLDRRGLAHPTFDANLRLGAVEIYLDRRGLSLS
jgi:hypothetical protein